MRNVGATVIFFLVKAPRTAIEISELGDLKPVSVRFWISVLSDEGLIAEAGTRVGRGRRMEKVFRWVGAEPTMTNDPKYVVVDGRLCSAVTGEPIPADEPVLILRGKDTLALDAVWGYYRSLCAAKHESTMSESMLDRVKTFDTFRKDNPERMKAPT
jgi:DNA-binding transcriptional ArsR family regulator